MRKPAFLLFATYNQQMNQTIIESMKTLNHDSLVDNQGAFFGSILGTLNHLINGDLIWLNRFNEFYPFKSLQLLNDFPKPVSLAELRYEDLASYSMIRNNLDAIIINFIEEIAENQLTEPMTYQNTKNQIFSREFGFLLNHFFNHQTHHRGQVSTLLFQQGIDI